MASQLMLYSDVLCLQETHGTHEYLQATAVIFLSGWILVGPFLADKKNAGGWVRKSFPSCKEGSNMWSCVMVKITWSLLRSGHGSCTIFLKPRLTQRELRKRLVHIHVEWPAYPEGLGVIIGDFDMCEPEEGRLNLVTQTFSEGDPGRTLVLFLELYQLDARRVEVSVCSTLRCLSRIDGAFINVPNAGMRFSMSCANCRCTGRCLPT